MKQTTPYTFLHLLSDSLGLIREKEGHRNLYSEFSGMYATCYSKHMPPILDKSNSERNQHTSLYILAISTWAIIGLAREKRSHRKCHNKFFSVFRTWYNAHIEFICENQAPSEITNVLMCSLIFVYGDTTLAAHIVERRPSKTTQHITIEEKPTDMTHTHRESSDVTNKNWLSFYFQSVWILSSPFPKC